MPSEQAHPHPHQQDQLYCVARSGAGLILQSGAAGKGEGHSSVWAPEPAISNVINGEGKGRRGGHLSLAHTTA